MERPKAPEQTIEELQHKVIDLVEQAKTIQASADADKRDLSQEEQGRIDAILDAVDQSKTECARRERLLNQERDLAIPQQRLTKPTDVDRQSIVASAPRSSGLRIESNEPKGAWGFRSFGEFAMSVKKAVRGGIDPRLIANAPTSYGQEAVGEDGGFAVPPDWRAEIMSKVMGEDSLLSRTDQQITSSNQIVIPKDETTPWQTSGGVQAYWEGEGVQKTVSKPELQAVNIRLNKLCALVPVTDELLEDAPALSNYLKRKAPEKINYRVNEAIIWGTGLGMPLGFMNSAATVTVSKVGSQTANTVVAANLTAMWARMYSPARKNAVWLVNQEVEPQLSLMTLTGGYFPAYLPPGGFSGQPFSSIFGRPVIATEAASALGTTGDIILADLSSYITGTKAGGIRSDTSIHLWFDYDITAFRFVLRVGGQPWWTSPIKRANGTSTLGAFVALETRS